MCHCALRPRIHNPLSPPSARALAQFIGILLAVAPGRPTESSPDRTCRGYLARAQQIRRSGMRPLRQQLAASLLSLLCSRKLSTDCLARALSVLFPSPCPSIFLTTITHNHTVASALADSLSHTQLQTDTSASRGVGRGRSQERGRHAPPSRTRRAPCACSCRLAVLLRLVC